MPIKPDAALITTSAGTVYVDEVSYTEALQNFDRLEYSNARLRSAPTLTGATPLIVQGFGNQPIQLLTTCTGDLPRPLGPDDANIGNIKKRWDIKRWTLKGNINTYATVNSLYTTHVAHLKLLNGFDLYLGELNMELSINYLQNTLQPITFANLTTTSFTMSGNVLGGSYSNLLISQFDAIAEYEAALPDGSGNSTVLYSFTATIENRVLDTQGPIGS